MRIVTKITAALMLALASTYGIAAFTNLVEGPLFVKGDLTSNGGDITGANGDSLDIGEVADSQFTFQINSDSTVVLKCADSTDSNTPCTLKSAGTGTLTVDTGGAGTVAIGSTATTVNICNSAACDTVNIATGADADTVTIGNGTSTTVVNVDTGTGGLDVDALGVISLDGELVVVGGTADGDLADGDADLYVVGDLEVDTAARFDGAVTLGNASSDAITVTGGLSDLSFSTGLAGGADIACLAAAADTAGQAIDVTGQSGGTASTDQVGKAGGAVTITAGAGSAKNGAGATDGDGGDVVLLGGARGGATGGSEVHGIVRVGSPTVGSTKATNVLAVGGAFEADGASRFDGAVTLGDASTDAITVTGGLSDLSFQTGLTGGADISCLAAAADTAGQSIDVTGQAGGAASTGQVGKNGGTITLTGGAGSAKDGAGATDGDGGDVVLLGGARGGSTGGTEVQGIVRVGSPTVGSTKGQNVLAVGGAFEVDGASRFDGTAAFNSTTTFQTGDIIAADILDITRSIPLPLHSWVPCADGVWDASGADAEPDLAATPATLLGIEYDDTGGSIDTGTICNSFVVPADYVSGGAFKARMIQDAATVTQVETFSCSISVDGAAAGGANAGNAANQTAVQTVTSTPAGTWAIGASIQVACSQGNASADDVVTFLAIEGQYTATE